MKKIRAFIIFALIPLIAGYLIASHQGHKVLSSATLTFSSQAILPTDQITLVEKGTIASITQKSIVTMQTNHPQLIETIPLGDTFIGVDKQTNYSSLLEFSSTGVFKQTLLNGNTKNIDTMNWYTDPAVSPNQKEIAFVSDQEKDKTNVLDNALFVDNLATNSVEKIVDPDPHSGGIANPVWDPTNSNLITFDYYQYDDSFNPYSLIQEYDINSQTTTNLTTQKQNAYQGSFSPDGKQFIFLERNDNITTKMALADVTANGLSNVRTIASGDFAYPEFSYTSNHIYYLQAQGNNGYDLYTAAITDGELSNPTAISNNEELLGNSGFEVSKVQKTN